MRTMKHGWLALAMTLLVVACASVKDNELLEMQYAWSLAIRWGDFEGAWNLVDPEYREANPMTTAEFERYERISISRYHEIGSQALPDGSVVRQIELGVINENTMTVRSTRYVERWRYDEEAGRWWQTSGLPDLWQGE